MNACVASYFWRNVLQQPDAAALAVVRHDVWSWLTWRELGQLASSAVSALQAEGLSPGEHVASCLPNSLAWILLDIAAQTAGNVHVAIDPRESPERRRQLVEFSRARLFVDSQTWPHSHPSQNFSQNSTGLPLHAYVEHSQAVAEDSPAQMLFTSGSTAMPKGVVLTHRNLVSNATAKLDAAPQFASDLRLNILPFSHAYARTCELTSWILSCSRLALASNWSELLHIAPRLKPTLLNLVPYLAEQAADELDRRPDALGGCVRLLQCGGAALANELWQRLARHGLPPLQGYGLTEASPVVCSNRAGLQRPGTVGPAVEGVELRIDADRILWCRGPNVMLGYWQDAAASASCLEDGWLCTGDIAEIDSQGAVTILGRSSHQLVLSTGYKVSPEVIERELLQEPWINHVLVFGDSHPYVVALVWPSPSFENEINRGDARQELISRIARRLNLHPRYAIPSRVAIIAEPLSQSLGTLTLKGTPRRSQIAARYSAELASLYSER